MRKKRSICISSTGWQRIELTAISNFIDDIKISDRKWNKKENCYVKTLEFSATPTSLDKMIGLLNHIRSNCHEETCTYCKQQKREGY